MSSSLSSSSAKYNHHHRHQQRRTQYQTQVVQEYRGHVFETVLMEQSTSQNNNNNIISSSLRNTRKEKTKNIHSNTTTTNNNNICNSFSRRTNQAALWKSKVKFKKLDDYLSNYIMSSKSNQISSSSSSEWVDFTNNLEASDLLCNYDQEDPIFSTIYTHTNSNNAMMYPNNHVFRSKYEGGQGKQQHQQQQPETSFTNSNNSKKNFKSSRNIADIWMKMGTTNGNEKAMEMCNEEGIEISLKMNNDPIMNDRSPPCHNPVVPILIPSSSGSSDSGRSYHYQYQKANIYDDIGWDTLPQSEQEERCYRKTRREASGFSTATSYWSSSTGGSPRAQKSSSPSLPFAPLDRTALLPSLASPSCSRTTTNEYDAEESHGSTRSSRSAGNIRYSRFSKLLTRSSGEEAKRKSAPERKNYKKDIKFSTLLPAWTSPYLSCVEDTTTSSTSHAYMYPNNLDPFPMTRRSTGRNPIRTSIHPAGATASTRCNDTPTKKISGTVTTRIEQGVTKKSTNRTITTTQTAEQHKSRTSSSHNHGSASILYANCFHNKSNRVRRLIGEGGARTLVGNTHTSLPYQNERPQQHRHHQQQQQRQRSSQGGRDLSVHRRQGNQQQLRASSLLQPTTTHPRGSGNCNSNNSHPRQGVVNYFGRNTASTTRNKKNCFVGRMSQGSSSSSSEESSVWREAKDPKTARTYYYNIQTRETQWRKPVELCSEEEKEEIRMKERKQKEFFASMEANILKTLSANITAAAGTQPGVSEETDGNKNNATKQKSFKSQTLRRISGLQRPGMVRTISAMDENVLLELTRVPSTKDAGRTPKPSMKRSDSGTRKLDVVDALEFENEDDNGGKTPAASNIHKTTSASATEASLGETRKKRQPRESFSLDEIVPLETLRESRAWGEELNQAGDFMSSQSQFDESFSFHPESSISSGLDAWCSSEEVEALRELSKVTKEMKNQSNESMSQSVPTDLVLEDSMRGDGLAFVNDSKDFTMDGSSGASNARDLGDSISNYLTFEDENDVLKKLKQEKEEEKIKPKENERNATKIPRRLATKKKEALLARPQMAKRNTCGTLYVSNTMSAPDKDATIKCVCGVYRAHILQSLKEEENNFMGPSVESEKFKVFNDFPHQRTPSPLTEEGELTIESLTVDEPSHAYPQEVPSLDDITRFYRDVFQRSQMETDCIIMSLIYVERLIKVTKGSLRPNVRNWRSILMSCMVLSSKVWDDLSMWNADFTKICPAGMAFSLERINELEIAVLNALHYSVKVASSEYAKYYFLMRSMIIKSGLSGGSKDIISNTPLDVEGAKKLEQVSSSFQVHLKKPKRRLPKKAKSLDFGSKSELEAVLNEGVGRTKPARASLEHIVNM